MKIGNTLKESRLNAKMTVKEISDILTSQGYKASEKTVYSWESGNSRPDIEILMKLCDIYGIKDILKTFGYDGYKEDGTLQLNMKEIGIIEKYRFISECSPEGAKAVDTILDREHSIAGQLQEKNRQISELEQASIQEHNLNQEMRIINYYYRLASAGAGQIVFDTPPTKRIEIPNVPEYIKVDYAIGVNGDSMEPAFHNGDTLLIEMTEKIEPGEIGIFLVDGESYVKKLGKRELISLNPEYKNIPLTNDSKCMGKVLGKL